MDGKGLFMPLAPKVIFWAGTDVKNLKRKLSWSVEVNNKEGKYKNSEQEGPPKVNVRTIHTRTR